MRAQLTRLIAAMLLTAAVAAAQLEGSLDVGFRSGAAYARGLLPLDNNARYVAVVRIAEDEDGFMRKFVLFYDKQNSVTRVLSWVWNDDDSAYHDLHGNTELAKKVEDKGTPTDTYYSNQPLPLAATPGGVVYYALNIYESPEIVAVDPTVPTIVATIPIARANPVEIALAPDGKTLYVLHGGSAPGVSFVDTTARAVTGTANLPSSFVPPQSFPMAISPDGTKLYIADRGVIANNQASPAGGILVYDIAARSVTATIPALSSAARDAFEGVFVSPDGTFLYGATPNAIRVIDTATATISTSVAVTSAGQVIFDPRGTRAYATTPSQLRIIDTATSTVLATVPFGQSFSSMSISRPGDTILAWEQPGIGTPTAHLKTFDTRQRKIVSDVDMGVVAPGYIASVP